MNRSPCAWSRSATSTVGRFILVCEAFANAVGERMKLEFIAESTNVFNRTNVVGMNSTATVDAAGNVVAWPELNWTAALDQRLLQLGFRFTF